MVVTTSPLASGGCSCKSGQRHSLIDGPLFAIPLNMRTFATRFLWRTTLVLVVFCAFAWRVGAASFTWDASPDAATGKVAGYKFYYSTQSFIALPLDVAINPAFKIVTVTSGTSVTVSDLLNGLTYFMAVTAFDANGEESVPSNILTYTAGVIQPPLTVAITDPAAPLNVSSTSTVTVTATAAGPAAITKVEFFDGISLLTTKTTAPYTLSQTFAAGVHIITAKATDANNSTATSAPITITSAVLTPLTVAITDPATAVSVSSTSTVTVTAAANGSVPIAQVDFFDGQLLLVTKTTPPYTFNQVFTSGVHVLTAKVTDLDNNTATSAPVTITSTAPAPDNLPPTVSLVGLVEGALLSQPVVLNASASDPDGTIASVEFFANSSSLGVVTTSPYTVSPRLISGTYALKAKATDNLGAVSFSSTITISVKPPPPVDLTIK
jgi:hypothetical protein